MTPQSRKKIIIGTAILVICGVIGYFIYTKISEDDKGEETPPVQPPGSTTDSTDKGTTGGVTKPKTENPFKNSDEVKKFQDWLDIKYPTWLNGGKLNKGKGYGTYGPRTKQAFSIYGNEYFKQTEPKETKPTTQTDQQQTLSLDELQKNLGAGIIPVERYTDKLIARIQGKDDAGNVITVAGVFNANNNPLKQRYIIYGPGNKNKLGFWSNGGKKIIMDNKRVLSSNNVWTNIIDSWKS